MNNESILNDTTHEPTKLETWLDKHKANTELCAAITAAVEKDGEDEIAVLEMSRPVGKVAIFRAPTAAEYKRLMGGLIGEKVDTKTGAAEQLARTCVLYPTKQEFGKWCDRYGGIGVACLKSLSRLAGADLADSGKE